MYGPFATGDVAGADAGADVDGDADDGAPKIFDAKTGGFAGSESGSAFVLGIEGWGGVAGVGAEENKEVEVVGVKLGAKGFKLGGWGCTAADG